VSENDERLVGESELDHRDRLEEARTKRSDEQKERELAEYHAGAVVILNRFTELVAEILNDVVGPTTITPWKASNGVEPGSPGTASAQIAATSDVRKREILCMLHVSPSLQGTKDPDEMTYFLAGYVGTPPAMIDAKLDKSNQRRPRLDLTHFRNTVREMVGLANR
jgi:hypothetical protein